ncbi:DUF262 domain-containing protein [Pectobacterium versatile]|uniref:DUF262 domain-containing protein n=1 Tax=Pectobacterium versatile TaxID=2488639 RepID=UPI001F230AC8|nr:DUF262 domain-containing protein [Pectobacterium versatile]
MKINTTDPDLRTIFARIDEGSLDLQPDFQRAEVWRLPKKKLLIDTILRGWQVPPVHVILNEESDIQEVLDGQQRLSAIRDFMYNKFKIDGHIEPLDDDIKELGGLTFEKLPTKIKNRFERYAIRVFEITEYNQGEPGELFNRLNESLKLTSAEKRNAYVGNLRNQIKSLVTYLDDNGLDKNFLGFSNQRMAYHDLFIKLCYMLEKKSLIASYTEKQLNDRAREDEPFDSSIIESVKNAIFILSKAREKLDNKGYKIHITKATLISWLYFFANILDFDAELNNELINIFYYFEKDRFIFKEDGDLTGIFDYRNSKQVKEILEEFNHRAVSRVMTGSSLLIRDFIISLFFVLTYSHAKNSFDIMKLSNIDFAIDSLTNNNYKNGNAMNIINEYCDSVLMGVTVCQ